MQQLEEIHSKPKTIKTIKTIYNKGEDKLMKKLYSAQNVKYCLQCELTYYSYQMLLRHVVRSHKMTSRVSVEKEHVEYRSS